MQLRPDGGEVRRGGFAWRAASGEHGEVMSVSPWWKTQRIRQAARKCAASEAALKRCTTWFLSPTGANSLYCRLSHS
jgi:hypothetical protein